MFRLAAALYSIIATALAGAGVIAVLSMGYVDVLPIVIAAGVGALVALPAAWMVAKKILNT